MTVATATGSGLGNAEPVPSVVWDLEFSLPDTLTDSVQVSTSESFGPSKVSVNTAQTAATLIDGTSSSNQNVNMTIGATPPPAGAATVVGDVVDLSFDIPGDLCVLQFTYDDVPILGGLTELDLRVLFFETGPDAWTEAITGNTDGGVGGSLFTGSFADFLAGPGSGTLDAADLSAYGVDSIANHVWAVLNHNSIFGVGVDGLQPLLGDVDLDGGRNADDIDRLYAEFANPTTWDPADLDFDGDADQDDVTRLIQDLLNTDYGDANLDMSVDLADFNIWLTALPPAAPFASAVLAPEPGTGALLAVGGLLTLRCRRRGATRV